MQTIITIPHPAAQRATVDSAARGLLITTLPRNCSLWKISNYSVSVVVRYRLDGKLD